LTEKLARFLSARLARFLIGKLVGLVQGASTRSKKNHLKCIFFDRGLQKQAQMPVFLAKNLMSIFLVKDDCILYYHFCG
jgi:hypothetical protein